MSNLYGSICLSDIPKEEIKSVMCKDGVTRKFLNVRIIERKTPSQYGNTHFISCAPKKDDQKEGVNYFIGDLKTSASREERMQPQQPEQPQQPQGTVDDLPW